MSIILKTMLKNLSVERLFIRYLNEFPDTEMIERKKLHSLRVAGLAEEIGRTEKHFLAGLVHDAGRFPQAIKYGTFDDSKSVDHGELGYEIIKGWGISDNDILNAVRYHNKLTVPDIKEKDFVNVIRDADIIDILQLVVEGKISPFGKFSDPVGEVTEEVKIILKERKPLPNRIRHQNGINNYLGKLALIYGITYKRSFDILEKRGIVDELQTVHSKDCETEKYLLFLYEDLKTQKDRCHEENI